MTLHCRWECGHRVSGVNKRWYFCCPHLHVGDLVLLPLVPLHLVLQQLPSCLHVAVVVTLTIHKHNINSVNNHNNNSGQKTLRLVQFHHQIIMWLSSSTTRLSWGWSSSTTRLSWGWSSSTTRLSWGWSSSTTRLSWRWSSSTTRLSWGWSSSTTGLSWGWSSSTTRLSWGWSSSTTRLSWGWSSSTTRLSWRWSSSTTRLSWGWSSSTTRLSCGCPVPPPDYHVRRGTADHQPFIKCTRLVLQWTPHALGHPRTGQSRQDSKAECRERNKKKTRSPIQIWKHPQTWRQLLSTIKAIFHLRTGLNQHMYRWLHLVHPLFCHGRPQD